MNHCWPLWDGCWKLLTNLKPESSPRYHIFTLISTIGWTDPVFFCAITILWFYDIILDDLKLKKAFNDLNVINKKNERWEFRHQQDKMEYLFPRNTLWKSNQHLAYLLNKDIIKMVGQSPGELFAQIPELLLLLSHCMKLLMSWNKWSENHIKENFQNICKINDFTHILQNKWNNISNNIS